jgi:hypothetical protein
LVLIQFLKYGLLKTALQVRKILFFLKALAGDTKVVYSDGAGAGAAFFDAFASLSVVDLKVQDDLTVTGDIDVDGTTNLDVVDIDGAVDMAYRVSNIHPRRRRTRSL